MGSKKNVDMTATSDTVKHVDPSTEVTTEAASSDTKPKKSVQKRVKGKKYVATRSQVDKTKVYDTFAAFELVKRLSYSSFDGTIVADLLVKEVGTSATLTFPHSTGKSVKVVIASDEVLEQIDAGNIDFDVLISEPQFVPKLAKYARVLGPKGLMPNPKNGTITPNPEAKKKELEAGKITIKTEKKQPVLHVTIGKVSMETKELQDNLAALIKAVGTDKVRRVSISASMSPSVRVQV